jgi:NhaA family Na+:H+ antiporter
VTTPRPSNGRPGDPRRPWVRRVLDPVEQFLAVESSSGIVLLVCAVIALGWANSPARGLYQKLWHLPLGAFSFTRDLHFWINDGLMAIFFFVVGLEIRRELHAGELSDRRRAALPVLAALGGMLAPALIFLAFNAGGAAARGWGVPTATDIAFAVGVLVLLGPRVRPAVRVLLLTLAVADDLGAILVIAIFYSSQLSVLGFLILGGGVLLLLVMQRLRVRATVAYLAPALVVWTGAVVAGIHPALAGVALGLLTPIGEVDRLQHGLHRWVAFGIMPLFALANAGVPLGNASFAGAGLPAFAGVVLGLALGKPAGILAFCWVATRIKIAALPAGMRWAEVLVLGMVAGIGFTMALFVAALAFPAGTLLETVKLAVLAGSFLSAVVGLVLGRLMLPRPDQLNTR